MSISKRNRKIHLTRSAKLGWLHTYRLQDFFQREDLAADQWLTCLCALTRLTDLHASRIVDDVRIVRQILVAIRNQGKQCLEATAKTSEQNKVSEYDGFDNCVVMDYDSGLDNSAHSRREIKSGTWNWTDTRKRERSDLVWSATQEYSKTNVLVLSLVKDMRTGQLNLFVKGRPGDILDMCKDCYDGSSVLTFGEDLHSRLEAVLIQWRSEGLDPFAFGYVPVLEERASFLLHALDEHTLVTATNDKSWIPLITHPGPRSLCLRPNPVILTQEQLISLVPSRKLTSRPHLSRFSANPTMSIIVNYDNRVYDAKPLSSYHAASLIRTFDASTPQDANLQQSGQNKSTSANWEKIRKHQVRLRDNKSTSSLRFEILEDNIHSRKFDSKILESSVEPIKANEADTEGHSNLPPTDSLASLSRLPLEISALGISLLKEMVCNEMIFLGMSAMRKQTPSSVTQRIRDFHAGGVRFMLFSKLGIEATRSIGNGLGLETDWNCLISLEANDKQAVPINQDGRAVLPAGIEGIQQHLEQVDDIPLLVSLYANSSPDTTKEMLRLLKDRGAVVTLVGSALRTSNFDLFNEVACPISILLLPYPLCHDCHGRRSVGSHYSPMLLPELSFSAALTSLPCALQSHAVSFRFPWRRDSVVTAAVRDQPYPEFLLQLLYSCFQESRRIVDAIECVLTFYALCVIVILGATAFFQNVLGIPVVIYHLEILVLLFIVLPLLALSLFFNPVSENAMLEFPQMTLVGEDIFKPNHKRSCLLLAGRGLIPSLSILILPVYHLGHQVFQLRGEQLCERFRAGDWFSGSWHRCLIK